MGYAMIIGECVACKRTVAFHPRKVPSILVNGVKRELCEMCARRWKAMHPDSNYVIQEGAYGPFPEEEL